MTTSGKVYKVREGGKEGEGHGCTNKKVSVCWRKNERPFFDAVVGDSTANGIREGVIKFQAFSLSQLHMSSARARKTSLLISREAIIFSPGSLLSSLSLSFSTG